MRQANASPDKRHRHKPHSTHSHAHKQRSRMRLYLATGSMTPSCDGKEMRDQDIVSGETKTWSFIPAKTKCCLRKPTRTLNTDYTHTHTHSQREHRAHQLTDLIKYAAVCSTLTKYALVKWCQYEMTLRIVTILLMLPMIFLSVLFLLKSNDHF